MTKSSVFSWLRPLLRSVATPGLFVLLLAGYLCAAQTAVILSPVPRLQFFDNSGRPLSFGCVFTYQVGTTTALATYTDNSGTTQNADPVVLSSGGVANIWLSAGQAYSFVIKAAGGTNCASGSTLYTVNGIGGGSSVLTTPVAYSATPSFQDAAQIQMFTITLTGDASAQPMTFVGVTPPGIIYFQITQDGVGGHNFSWPANTVGGCTIGKTAAQVTTQAFVYNGTNATATGPCIVGNGPAINVGAIVSNAFSLFNGFLGCAEGAGLLGVAGEDILWCDSTAHRWEMTNNGSAPADTVVGAATTDTFTNKTLDTAGLGNVLKINSNQVSTVQGNTNKVQLATGATTSGDCLSYDASGNAQDAGTKCTGFNAPQRVVLGAPVGMTGNVQAIILTESVTFPAAAGNYRADVRYGLFITLGSNVCVAEVIDTTNNRAWALSGQNANGVGYIGLSASEVSTQTYAAGATATFTLQAVCNDAAAPHLVGATVNSGLLTITPAEPTFLEVVPVLSN